MMWSLNLPNNSPSSSMMEDEENRLPSASPSPRAVTPDLELPQYSSLLEGAQQKTCRLRKPANVTPRTFTRFFTPKSYIKKATRSSKHMRTPLSRLSSSSINSSRCPSADIATIEDTSSKGVRCHQARKRRRIEAPLSPEVTPERSSPIKSIYRQSLTAIESRIASPVHRSRESPSESPERRTIHIHSEDTPEAISIPPSSDHEYTRRLSIRCRGFVSAQLQRELGGKSDHTWQTAGLADQHVINGWQHETANFYTMPDDTHLTENVAETGDLTKNTLPFCTASCNTNSLVAVGDEDGGVRLLETVNDDKATFGKAWLSFLPHRNAILALDFSPDDLLLATASGDQTSQVIDMMTQQTTYTMAGHTSSVKQVRFQPGNSSIIATSSRDGSVQIWDLRTKGHSNPVQDIKVSLDPDYAPRPSTQAQTIWARPIDTIYAAHTIRIPSTETAVYDPYKCKGAVQAAMDAVRGVTEHATRNGDVSVTCLSFLDASRPNLLITGSEANACVRLWDLRTTHNRRSIRVPTPLSTTSQPQSHDRHRAFAITSMILSSDAARLYTLCKDSTVYTYSTAHLVLGHSPELSYTRAPRLKRAGSSRTGSDKKGLRPLYGFRHPKFHATSFYVSCALRPARDDQTELLAVGSSDNCAVLFPTDERYLQNQDPSDDMPIYNHGTALVRGHNSEVSGLTFSQRGELVTVGDDSTARCWREGDREAARSLRVGGEGEGKRWGCGWAEVEDNWDDEDG